jgi:hypothetical protein
MGIGSGIGIGGKGKIDLYRIDLDGRTLELQ